MTYFKNLPTAREIFAEVSGKKEVKFKEYAIIIERKIQLAKEELATECEVKGPLEQTMCDELKKLGYSIKFDVNKKGETVTVISWSQKLKY